MQSFKFSPYLEHSNKKINLTEKTIENTEPSISEYNEFKMPQEYMHYERIIQLKNKYQLKLEEKYAGEQLKTKQLNNRIDEIKVFSIQQELKNHTEIYDTSVVSINKQQYEEEIAALKNKIETNKIEVTYSDLRELYLQNIFKIKLIQVLHNDVYFQDIMVRKNFSTF